MRNYISYIGKRNLFRVLKYSWAYKQQTARCVIEVADKLEASTLTSAPSADRAHWSAEAAVHQTDQRTCFVLFSPSYRKTADYLLF